MSFLKRFIRWCNKPERAEDIQCPTCGYYCLGKGGYWCIDKPKLWGIERANELKEDKA